MILGCFGGRGIFCFGEDRIGPVDVYSDKVKKICKPEYQEIEDKKKEIISKKISPTIPFDNCNKVEVPDVLNDLSMWGLENDSMENE